jgi:hypothetical protein
MSFVPHRGRALLSILASTTLLFGVSACAPRISINRAALPCSGLIPPQLANDVAGADLPPENPTVGDLYVALDQQTGRLDTANGYKRAAIDIVKACEARDAEVDKALSKRGRLFGIF